METTEQVTIISNEEAATLNAARVTLKEIADRLRYSAVPDNGMVAATARHAEWLVFETLNYARVYLGAPLTDEQVQLA